jgi:hypothetical protein
VFKHRLTRAVQAKAVRLSVEASSREEGEASEAWQREGGPKPGSFLRAAAEQSDEERLERWIVGHQKAGLSK